MAASGFNHRAMMMVLSTPRCLSPAVPKQPFADQPANLDVEKEGSHESNANACFADLLLQSEFEVLHSKLDALHQADAALRNQEEIFRKQRKGWMSTIDTFMQLAQKRNEATADARNKATVDAQYNTACTKLDQSPSHLPLNISKFSVYCGPAAVGALHMQQTQTGFSIEKEQSDLRIVASPTSRDSHSDWRRQVAETVSKEKVVNRLEFPRNFTGELSQGRRQLQKIVRSNAFEAVVFGLILINVVFVGIEVDYMGSHPGIATPQHFVVINYCFTFSFLVELLLRVMSEGRFFCQRRNPDWSWNSFDCFVVLSSIVDNLASSFASSDSVVDVAHFRVTRVIRVTRLLRTFRMVRMVRFIRALRTLVHSIIVTLRAAIWSLLLMIIILYGFGVVFTQATMDYCDLQSTHINDSSGMELRAAGCSNSSLLLFFGTLPRSMFTLLKCVAGGVSWHEVVVPLSEVGSLWVLTFIIYVVFVLFAVFNVLNGLFCQSAAESAQQDKDIATMQMVSNKRYFKNCLHDLFHHMDSDNSGYITIQEFEDALHKEKCQAFFESLDIPVNDAWALFQLLDADESGSIDEDEFFMGCLHLRGNASAVDIAKMHHEHMVFFDFLEKFMSTMEQHMLQLLQTVPQAMAGGAMARDVCADLQAAWTCDKQERARGLRQFSTRSIS